MNGDPQTISGGNVEDEQGNVLPPEQQGVPVAPAAPVAPQPTPLRGLQQTAFQALPDEGEDQEVPLKFPSEQELRGETGGVPVRLEYFGRDVPGHPEYGHAANYGPDRRLLQPNDVAISPNIASQLNLKLGDWVWVGSQLRRYGDYSYITPNRPTANTVEVRDYPADGRSTLRKATPDEVAQYVPGGGEALGRKLAAAETGQRLSPMMASMMTGKSPEQIDTSDIKTLENQILQQQIEGQSRGLLAGPITAASIEGSYGIPEGGGGGAAAVAEEPDYNGDTANQMAIDAENSAMGAGGQFEGMTDGMSYGNMPMPSTRGVPYTVDPSDGTYHYQNGMTANPNTGVVTWEVKGRTFSKIGPFGHTVGQPTIRPYKGPDGMIYDLNNNMKPLNVEGMIPKMTPEQFKALNDLPAPPADASPDPHAQEREDLALRGLTPEQASTVKMLAEYRLPVTAYALRNPYMQYAIARANALNPNFQAGAYDQVKRMLIDYGLQKTGTAGGTIRSINQAIQHTAFLDQIVQAMHNSQLPAANSLKNWLQTKEGKPYVIGYNQARDLVALELARATKGFMPTEKEINDEKELFSSSDSPEQLNYLIKTVIPTMLGGALDTWDAGYAGVMGKRMGMNKLIFPETQEALKNLDQRRFAGRDLLGPAEMERADAVDSIKNWNIGHPNEPPVDFNNEANIQNAIRQRQAAKQGGTPSQ